MPPKVMRKGQGVPLKKVMRGVKSTEPVKLRLPREQYDEEKEATVEENRSDSLRKIAAPLEKDKNANQSRSAPSNRAEYLTHKQDEEHKESMVDYEKGERLDLEEDDDPDEDVGVDEDDKELEHSSIQEIIEKEEEENEEIGEDEGIIEEFEVEIEEHPLEDDPKHIEMSNVAEEDEHHEVVKERRKRKEFEIFVGGLDKDATEEDLRKLFSEVGKVTEIRLMMNPQTRKNKGFAFLRFETVEQAKRAVTELKNPVINGKQCGVTPSEDSDTLFLGNICKSWSKEDLKEKLKHFGVSHVDDLTLVEDTITDGMNRGFAFLEFSSRSDAMDAFKRLQRKDVSFGVDRPAKVSFADSFIDPGDEIMAQVRTVFVDGFPATWDEEHVQNLLKKYGPIEKIELARNMPSARRMDFGFVTFDSHECAVTCAKSINNSEIGDGENKAKVRARLSRPLQRGKGKHFSRGDYRRPSSSSRGAMMRPLSYRSSRGIDSRLPPSPTSKRPIGYRERRPPVVSLPSRSRHVPPPSRSYDRRAPPPPYPKSNFKREYARHETIPSRNYTSMAPPPERRPFREEYAYRMSGFSESSRVPSRPPPRRSFDEGYEQRFERPPAGYRELRERDYPPVSGSKRPYTSMDDAIRYTEASGRHMRTRLDYDIGPSAPYGDAYGERIGRPSISYGSRSQDSHSHGIYNNRHGINYGGSYNGNEGGGMMYSSGYGSDYPPRGGEVRGSYSSSMYSGRGMGGSTYMGHGGSSSYY